MRFPSVQWQFINRFPNCQVTNRKKRSQLSSENPNFFPICLVTTVSQPLNCQVTKRIFFQFYSRLKKSDSQVYSDNPGICQVTIEKSVSELSGDTIFGFIDVR